MISGVRSVVIVYLCLTWLSVTEGRYQAGCVMVTDLATDTRCCEACRSCDSSVPRCNKRREIFSRDLDGCLEVLDTGSDQEGATCCEICNECSSDVKPCQDKRRSEPTLQKRLLCRSKTIEGVHRCCRKQGDCRCPQGVEVECDSLRRRDAKTTKPLCKTRGGGAFMKCCFKADDCECPADAEGGACER